MASPSDRTAYGTSFGGIIDAFEAALQRGEQPRIPDYLPRPDDIAVLVELLHVEMEFKLKNGMEASVAEYLANYPQLAADRAAIVALIEAEYGFRVRIDSSLARATFLARYPDFAAELAASAHDSVTSKDRLESGQGPTGDYGRNEVKSGLIIAGRYTLVDRLGEGGMGEVWVAKQIEPVKRNVALKLIKPGMDSRAVLQRFEQERQALAMMDHPNIAKVLDGGLTEERRPFFVMELANGLPLTRFCDEAKLGIRARLELFVPICQAVQHAHQKGIVHRDLKPSNILVTLIDGLPVPKVIDFGVAKAIGGKLTDELFSTQFGAAVGTLEYMAPEQAGFSGADVDTRADIYSLGVIVYELLTGLRPFDSKRLRKAAFDEMVRMIREEEPSRPSMRLSTDEASPSLAAVRQIEPRRLTKLLRGELDWLVMKCLEKQRDRRYETASGLARDVQRFLADEAVEARPPSAAYRLRKFLRRNRRAAIAASLVILALVGGIAGTTWGLIRAARANAQADADRRIAEVKDKAATQITDYLVQIFQTADPIGLDAQGFRAGGARAQEDTARRMLERGAILVHDHLRDQPAVRAGLLDAMGNAYRNLGDWNRAAALLDEAHTLRRNEFGDQHPDTVASLFSLAKLNQDRGDYAEADRLYRVVLTWNERQPEPDYRAIAKIEFYLGWMTFLQPLSGPVFDDQQLRQAEQWLLQAKTVIERHLPDHNRDLGFVLAALAAVKSCQIGQQAAAILYGAQALKEFERSGPHSEIGNAAAVYVLAEHARHAGRLEEAEAGYLKVLAFSREQLGKQHPLLVLQLGNLAGLYNKWGKAAAAEKAAREALEIGRPLPMRNAPACVEALALLASWVRPRDPIEAEQLYREALRYGQERPQQNAVNIQRIETALQELRREKEQRKK